MRRVMVLTMFALCSGQLTTASGQDALILETDGGQTSRRTGLITAWQGDRITLDSGGDSRQYDAERVRRVETLWPPPLESARPMMAAGKYGEAIPLLRAAIAQEDREWVKAIVRAELVQSLDAIGQSREATIEFLKIFAADAETRFFHLIPLSWTATRWNRPPETDSQQWLQSGNSLLQLLGASWQFSGSRRDAAVNVLETLSDDPDRRIAQLAAAQLWRLTLPSVDQPDLDRWILQLQNIDRRLRAGPLLLLAEAHQNQGQIELAQIGYLKIPILYPEQKSLAAHALFACASLMEREGQGKQANRLWKELARKFPDSQYGENARQKF